jgi:hypothetical protein
MKADRINRLIIISSLSICLFLLLDSYVLPLDTYKGVLVTKTGTAVSRLRVVIYTVQTERGLLTVPSSAYEIIRENDTIVVSRSFVTHSISKVAVYKKGAEYSWRIGFIPLGGLDFLLLLIAGNALYLFFFYNKLKRPQTRRDISIFLVSLTVLFLVFYFLFE